MEVSVISFSLFVHKTCSAWHIPPLQTLRRSFRCREYDSGIFSTTALFQQTCSSVTLEGQLRVPSDLITCSLCSPTFEFLDKTISSCSFHVYSFAEIWVLSSVILFIVPDTLMQSKSNRWLKNPQIRLTFFFSHQGVSKIRCKGSFHLGYAEAYKNHAASAALLVLWPRENKVWIVPIVCTKENQF